MPGLERTAERTVCGNRPGTRKRLGGSLCCLDPQPGDSGGPWRTPDAEGPTFCPLHPEEAFHDPSKTVPAPASHWQRRPLPLGKGPSLRAEGNAAALGPVPAPPRPLLTPATQSHSNPTSSPPAGPLYLLWPLPDALSDPHCHPVKSSSCSNSPSSREPSLQGALPDLQGCQLPWTGPQSTSAALPRRRGSLLLNYTVPATRPHWVWGTSGMHHSPQAGWAPEVIVGVKTWRNGG